MSTRLRLVAGLGGTAAVVVLVALGETDLAERLLEALLGLLL